MGIKKAGFCNGEGSILKAICLENVRCFTETGRIPLAPLTLLVGENSTGKSSFLALSRVAWDIVYNPGNIDFNEEPFLLGAYDHIANFRGGPRGRSKFFRIYLELPIHERLWKGMEDERSSVASFEAVFKRGVGQPVLTDFAVDFRAYKFRVEFGEKSANVVFSKGEAVAQTKFPFADDVLNEISLQTRGTLVDWNFFVHRLMMKFGYSRGAEEPPKLVDFPASDDLRFLRTFFLTWDRRRSGRPFASAPVRSKPERTYDPKIESDRAEGRHVPMVLARTYYDKENWPRLKEALEKFGGQAGLFRNIQIKPLGKPGSGPFQVLVKISGPANNFIDVGYGVSQALPILVDSILGKRNQIFLFQQPEIHLHPRGQAELGTFLCEIIKESRKQFLVETHSDYLIDRVRMEVRDGSIPPNDVILLYFERKRSGSAVKIHPIRFDKEGNLIGAPSGYRKFFLAEGKRFLVG